MDANSIHSSQTGCRVAFDATNQPDSQPSGRSRILPPLSASLAAAKRDHLDKGRRIATSGGQQKRNAFAEPPTADRLPWPTMAVHATRYPPRRTPAGI